MEVTNSKAGWRGSIRPDERATALSAVVAIHAILAAMLLTGLAPRFVRQADPPLKVFDLEPVRPTPARAAATERDRPKDAAAPDHRLADPKAMVVPRIVLPRPVLLAAAPVAGTGRTPTAGSALSGAGTGAGGAGSGTGGGGRGGGVASHAQWIAGMIVDRDYPEEAKQAGMQGVVAILFTVHRDGRVSDCRIDHSSGSVELDRMTCALAEQRLRYAPARDGAGQPVEEVTGRYFTFVLGHRRSL